MEAKYRIYGENAVQRALDSGAAMAEAYINNSKELEIEVRDTKVETLKLAEDRGMGIRVFQEGKTGFAFTTDFGVTAIGDAVEQALANARLVESDPYRLLAKPALSYPAIELPDPAIQAASVEEKIELACIMEKAAKSRDSRVSIIESAAYQDAEGEITLVSSNGLALQYSGSFCGMHISLVAGAEGDNQTGFAMNFGLRYGDLNPETLGKLAAERAVRMLGAKTAATQQAAVILEPYVANGVLGILSASLSAEAVQKGRSLMRGKIGQQVASSKISIIDDGALAGGIVSAPFDGEGTPTSRTELLKNGVLQGYLHNIYTAAKDGVQSTGNGMRGSYKGIPEVGASNFFLEPGEQSPEEIIAEVETGLYVTQVMGLHTANPISGDFSLGADGLWIEKGKLAYPVRSLAIAGNIMELLQEIDALGNDLTFYGSRGAPTVRIKQISISGS